MIRRIYAQEIEQVLKLWLAGNREAHAFIADTYWLANLAPVRQQLLDAELWGYEYQAKLVGFAGFQGDYLAGIFIARNYRDRGLGKELLDFLKRVHPNFTLSVYRKNVRAVKFYQREGLELVSKAIDEQTGQEELVMEWQGGQN
ncbi:GNAT family N-acetyltransferase [Ligilactobacillus agilis]|uniref:GNAT family N-acetyltransferase n=1 Tax=Ligilactobacillus agilis TaxID=1601 RepID=UPI00067F2C84|nr:GNAT family N-acetyltransferase [Ligilactobacillus agilis]